VREGTDANPLAVEITFPGVAGLDRRSTDPVQTQSPKGFCGRNPRYIDDDENRQPDPEDAAFTGSADAKSCAISSRNSVPRCGRTKANR
jgi:hypothetical protein